MVYFSLLESVLTLYHKHTIICLITIAALSVTCQLDFVTFMIQKGMLGCDG